MAHAPNRGDRETPPRRFVRGGHREPIQGDRFAHRPDDIVVASSYESGTMLTHQIVNLLLRGADDRPAEIGTTPTITEETR